MQTSIKTIFLALFVIFFNAATAATTTIDETIGSITLSGSESARLIDGASIGALEVIESSQVLAEAGEIQMTILRNDASLIQTGTQMGATYLFDNGALQVNSAENVGWVSFWSSTSTAEFFVQSGAYKNGVLSGISGDGNVFSTLVTLNGKLQGPSLMPANLIVTTIPEQSTSILLLLGLPLLLLGKCISRK